MLTPQSAKGQSSLEARQEHEGCRGEMWNGVQCSFQFTFYSLEFSLYKTVCSTILALKTHFIIYKYQNTPLSLVSSSGYNITDYSSVYNILLEAYKYAYNVQRTVYYKILNICDKDFFLIKLTAYSSV